MCGDQLVCVGLSSGALLVFRAILEKSEEEETGNWNISLAETITEHQCAISDIHGTAELTASCDELGTVVLWAGQTGMSIYSLITDYICLWHNVKILLRKVIKYLLKITFFVDHSIRLFNRAGLYSYVDENLLSLFILILLTYSVYSSKPLHWVLGSSEQTGLSGRKPGQS